MAEQGMATAERPPAKIDGKPNPAYQAWYRAQKKAKKDAPAEPEVLTLRAVKLANNDRYVLCAHPAEKGKTLAVRILKRGAAAKMLRKPIRVQMRDGKAHQVR